MRRRFFAVIAWLFVLGSLLVAPFSPAQAQQTTNIRRIGLLSATAASAVSDRTAAFRQGLRELGYIEGKNIEIEWRYAEGRLDRQRELAAELVRLKV